MDNKWYIWSVEHTAWWAPNSMGYTQDQKRAGKYTFDEAVQICTGANRFCRTPNETMVPENGEK